MDIYGFSTNDLVQLTAFQICCFQIEFRCKVFMSDRPFFILSLSTLSLVPLWRHLHRRHHRRRHHRHRRHRHHHQHPTFINHKEFLRRLRKQTSSYEQRPRDVFDDNFPHWFLNSSSSEPLAHGFRFRSFPALLTSVCSSQRLFIIQSRSPGEWKGGGKQRKDGKEGRGKNKRMKNGRMKE